MDLPLIIKQIVDKIIDDDIELTCSKDEIGILIRLKPKKNVNLLIGRNGRTIDAIRTLAKAMGNNGKHRVRIVIDGQKKS